MQKPPKISDLGQKLDAIYNSFNLETTCPGHCVCCNVSCPQMNYSEFINIVNEIYNNKNEDKRIDILKKSIKYFFSMKLVKPCPLLHNKECSVYKIRPLSCRLYGQWPEDMYEERVNKFIDVTGMKKEDIPLNTQCKYVERVSSEELTKDIINQLYKNLDELDMVIGDFEKEQVDKKYNQRTWHDWFLLKVFGEDVLVDLTNFLLAAENKEDVDDFVDQLCIQVEKVGQDVFSDR